VQSGETYSLKHSYTFWSKIIASYKENKAENNLTLNKSSKQGQEDILNSLMSAEKLLSYSAIFLMLRGSLAKQKPCLASTQPIKNTGRRGRFYI